MGNRLYVGNLSYNTTNSDLETLFSQHGKVDKIDIISDRDTGQSKGFGFVQMSTNEEAQAAITALHEKDVDGRKLTVNEAKPREERPRSGSGGFGGNKGRSESRGYVGGGGGRRGY